MEQVEEKLTRQQQKALHLYFHLLAEELNKAGLDMKVVLKPEVDIPWTKATVKDWLWRPVQKAYLKKQSTKDLNKLEEINNICDIINRHLGEKFGGLGFEFVPFPCLEELEKQL